MIDEVEVTHKRNSRKVCIEFWTPELSCRRYVRSREFAEKFERSMKDTGYQHDERADAIFSVRIYRRP